MADAVQFNSTIPDSQYAEFETVSVGETNKGTRKRKKNVSKREQQRRERYKDPHGNEFRWQRPCKHGNTAAKTCVYQCSKLSEADIKAFRLKLFASTDKVEQDTFLLLNVAIGAVRKRRATDPRRCRDQANSFNIKLLKGEKVRVCRSAFQSAIKPIGATRLTGVLKRNFDSGCPPKEKRGGDRVKRKNYGKKQCIRDFIKKLRGRESHYGRNKSVRIYLPAELKSIRNLHRLYNQQAALNRKVSHSMFHNIFVGEFNIGFSSPRVDVCTTCEKLRNQITLATDQAKKAELMVQRRVHKLRADAFYSILKRHSTSVPETHTIAFDLQQVQILPKVPVQEAFYSRQLALYNFAVCDLSNNKNYTYTWTENQAGRGSVEVSSAVHHYLCNILPTVDNFEQLNKVMLVSDGCGGQNKNNILLGMAQSWLYNVPENITSITLLYPVRGHSFLPCDRLFGRIQHDLKLKDTIVHPEVYHATYRKHCNAVHVLSTDWTVHDWKLRASNHYKTLDHIQEAKRIVLERSTKRNQTVITVANNPLYRSETGDAVSLLKRRARHISTAPPMIKAAKLITKAKLADIQNLLRVTYGDEWKANPDLKLYTTLQCTADNVEDAEDDVEHEYQDCGCCDSEPVTKFV